MKPMQLLVLIALILILFAVWVLIGYGVTCVIRTWPNVVGPVVGVGLSAAGFIFTLRRFSDW